MQQNWKNLKGDGGFGGGNSSLYKTVPHNLKCKIKLNLKKYGEIHTYAYLCTFGITVEKLSSFNLEKDSEVEVAAKVQKSSILSLTNLIMTSMGYLLQSLFREK